LGKKRQKGKRARQKRGLDSGESHKGSLLLIRLGKQKKIHWADREWWWAKSGACAKKDCTKAKPTSGRQASPALGEKGCFKPR